MDKLILIPSAILGLTLIAIYCYRCWKNKTEFQNGVMINTGFQASGIVCGIFLVLSVFYPEIRNKISGLDIYIFVSGLAVVAVSLQGFHRDAIIATTMESTKNKTGNVSNTIDNTTPQELNSK